MKIECKLKRNGGSKVDIDGIEYHFEPLNDGAHVADVEDKDHIDRFLAISEGYRVYHGELAPEGKPQTIAAAVGLAVKPEEKTREGAFLYGSSDHASQYTIGDATYSLGDIVRKAFEASQLSEDDWNALEEEDRAARIDIVLDDLQTAFELSEASKPDPVKSQTPAPEQTPAAAPEQTQQPAPEPVKAPAPEAKAPVKKAAPKAAAKTATKAPVKKSTTKAAE